MKIASETGFPPMRPLFVDFPDDPACATIEDQYMFGAEILVAPILQHGARERRVYLPAGTDWLEAGKGTPYSGGQWINAPAPLETIPVYLKADNNLQEIFRPK